LINQETIAAVQGSVQIAEVIADFVSLKKKGQNMWALCPFHHEKSPSFAVSPSKGFYKCFGCDAKGDAINFLMALEGMTFTEAIQYLAQKYGISFEETSSHEDEATRLKQNEKESLHILLQLAAQYHTKQLWEHTEGKTAGLSYLQERGFTVPFIKKFDLGYSLEAWDDFYLYAQEHGYNDELLKKSGLIVEKTTRRYDWFRKRIIFPIHNISGKIIAFGARVVGKGSQQPKYINSPETIVYHKGEILYGLYQAKQKVKQLNNCYLVEGYTDVIALHMAGVENVAAVSGTSLTEQQLHLIGRFTKNITFLFDGDIAGKEASLRSIDKALTQGMNNTSNGLKININNQFANTKSTITNLNCFNAQLRKLTKK